MKAFSRTVLVLSSAFITQNVFANPDMKHCVDYIRSQSELRGYIPINDDGQTDVKAMNDIVAKKRASYTLRNNVEEIKAAEGSTDVVINVKRDAGVITSITAKSVYNLYGGISGSNSNNEREVVTREHTFKYIGDTCVPSSEAQTQGSQIKGNLQNIKKRTIFDYDYCKNLREFFKSHPDAKACANREIAEKLEKVVQKGPKDMQYSGAVQGLSLGNWSLAFYHHKYCEDTAGLSDALGNPKLQEVASSKSKSSSSNGSIQ